MQLCGSNVEWCNTTNYLEVHLITGKVLRLTLVIVEDLFYAACNSVFAHGSGVDETVILMLRESYRVS